MFTEKQEKTIFQIMNLFKDENFKESRMKVYNNTPDMLNPLEMYVIEEIQRLGYKNYFRKLISCKKEDKDIIEEYNSFMNKCRNNFDFELNKVKDYYKRINDLTDLEKFCISLILKNEEKKTLLDKRSKYEYDDLYEIKYSTDEELKETIANIIVSLGIYSILKIDDGITRGIKERQLSKGIFSHLDKKYLIDLISSNPSNMKDVEVAVERFYEIAKMTIDSTSNEDSFNFLFGLDVNEYRTNITAKEIFGMRKDKAK